MSANETPESAHCLCYCSLPFSGRGWPVTCVSVLANFRENGLSPTLVLPRVTAEIPQSIGVVEALTFPFSRMPWRAVSTQASVRVERRFIEMLENADPSSTIAYFWPGTTTEAVVRARDLGFVTVREMINTYQGTAKSILDDAYRRAGLPPTHTITQQDVDDERAELELYDFIFASNQRVEDSLREAAVAADRVLSTSFGWSPSRFADEAPPPKLNRSSGFSALFVGSLSVRKGIPELLSAWKQSGVDGELVLVGDVEPALRAAIDEAVSTSRVRHVPFTSNIGEYYRAADVFVFPTLEEGGPQVTLEAAGCGLPVITTSMGAARLITHRSNGLIVDEGDVTALASALAELAHDPQLRMRMAAQAASDATKFDYEAVSASRAKMLLTLLAQRDQR